MDDLIILRWLKVMELVLLLCCIIDIFFWFTSSLFVPSYAIALVSLMFAITINMMGRWKINEIKSKEDKGRMP
jgi:membrane protein YdbS with pleckstrin-like domain